MPAGRVVIREVVVASAGSVESADVTAAASPSAVAVVDPALPAVAVAVPIILLVIFLFAFLLKISSRLDYE